MSSDKEKELKKAGGPHTVIEIPGRKKLTLAHLVLDYNGTIAVDGKPVWGVKDRIKKLSRMMTVHVITADTFGTVQQHVGSWPCTIAIISSNDQDKQKADYCKKLGTDLVVAIGNGRNDKAMLDKAKLGIGIIGTEGAALKAIDNADAVCTSITDALDLLLKPDRLKALLRN